MFYGEKIMGLHDILQDESAKTIALVIWYNLKTHRTKGKIGAEILSEFPLERQVEVVCSLAELPKTALTAPAWALP